MKKLLSAIILLVIAISMIAGSTFAHFVDSEISPGNVFQTGSLDLLVNEKNDSGAFWGEGIGPVSEIDDGHINSNYPFSIGLWNTSTTDGDACIHIIITDDPNGLASQMKIKIWYAGELKQQGFMSDLTLGGYLPLGPLFSTSSNDVSIELLPTAGAPGNRIAYTLEFDLKQWSNDGDSPFFHSGFIDSEKSEGNFFTIGIQGNSGTRGFWQSWANRPPHSEDYYSQEQINLWLAEIDGTSGWLEDTDGDGDFDTDDLDTILLNGTGAGATNYSRFLAHYLAQRLDQAAGRQDSSTLHDISLYDPLNYLGVANTNSAGGSEIIMQIESKYPASPSPTNGQFEIMKNICVALNQLDI